MQSQGRCLSPGPELFLPGSIPFIHGGEGSKKDLTIGHSFHAQNGGRIQYDKSYPFAPKISQVSALCSLHLFGCLDLGLDHCQHLLNSHPIYSLLLPTEMTLSHSCLKLFKGKIHSRLQRGDLRLLLHLFPCTFKCLLPF